MVEHRPSNSLLHYVLDECDGVAEGVEGRQAVRGVAVDRIGARGGLGEGALHGDEARDGAAAVQHGLPGDFIEEGGEEGVRGGEDVCEEGVVEH